MEFVVHSILTCCSGVSEALKLLKESEVLKIEDILPIIPHFTVIDDIKDEICHSLEEYNGAIEQLKAEMNDYTKTAENIRKEIEEQDKKFQASVSFSFPASITINLANTSRLLLQRKPAISAVSPLSANGPSTCFLALMLSTRTAF